jgi:fimbrial chaperone protein
MSKKALRAVFAAILIGYAVSGAGAFSLEPMTTLLAPSGPKSVTTFRIKNEGPERVALRFRVLTRRVGEGGIEINAPADELFIVYPARMVVEGGAAASVKLQWRGPTELEAERPFLFVAEQVPIDAAAGRGSNLRIMFRCIASLYVGDEGFAPDLSASATGAAGPKGENGYLVIVRNAGKRHVIANGLGIELAGESAAPLSGEELGALSGANYLPVASKTAFVPRPEAVVGKAYEAKLRFDPAY